MADNEPMDLPAPSGQPVVTEAQERASDWASPTGPASPVLSTNPARPEPASSGSRGWLLALVALGIGILILVFIAVASSVVGTANSIREDPYGPGVPVFPASGDVSATLLSGYDKRGKAVAADGQEVLAAAVRIENSEDAEQQYYVRVKFTDSAGEGLASKRLEPLVGAGQVVSRNVFTGVPRPVDSDVTVTVSAERSDPLSMLLP